LGIDVLGWDICPFNKCIKLMHDIKLSSNRS
jgi:hypothetical protein